MMTYEQTVDWIAENDLGPSLAIRDELDVDMVYNYRTVALTSVMFGKDRRIVATDVVRRRVQLKK